MVLHTFCMEIAIFSFAILNMNYKTYRSQMSHIFNMIPRICEINKESLYNHTQTPTHPHKSHLYFYLNTAEYYLWNSFVLLNVTLFSKKNSYFIVGNGSHSDLFYFIFTTQVKFSPFFVIFSNLYRIWMISKWNRF